VGSTQPSIEWIQEALHRGERLPWCELDVKKGMELTPLQNMPLWCGDQLRTNDNLLLLGVRM
jgi:hypothetical protein